MSEEIEIIKEHFIKEYRANGGTDDLSGEDIKFIMSKNESQKEIKALKDQITKNAKPSQKPNFNSNKNGVDEGKHNAAMAAEFAKIYGAYQDYIEPPFDKREIDDSSFKRDNSLGVFADKRKMVVILRDNEGRCDCGGPTKYKDGVVQW